MKHAWFLVLLCGSALTFFSCGGAPTEPLQSERYFLIGDTTKPAAIEITQFPDTCARGVFFMSELKGVVNNVYTKDVKVHAYTPDGMYMYKGFGIDSDGVFSYPLMECGTRCGVILVRSSWPRHFMINWETVLEDPGVLAIDRGN